METGDIGLILFLMIGLSLILLFTFAMRKFFYRRNSYLLGKILHKFDKL